MVAISWRWGNYTYDTSRISGWLWALIVVLFLYIVIPKHLRRLWTWLNDRLPMRAILFMAATVWLGFALVNSVRTTVVAQEDVDDARERQEAAQRYLDGEKIEYDIIRYAGTLVPEDERQPILDEMVKYFGYQDGIQREVDSQFNDSRSRARERMVEGTAIAGVFGAVLGAFVALLIESADVAARKRKLFARAEAEKAVPTPKVRYSPYYTPPEPPEPPKPERMRDKVLARVYPARYGNQED